MKRTLALAFVLLSSIFSFAQAANETVKALNDFENKLNATTDPQILDVRSAEEFAQNHLKYAVNIEAQEEDVERQLQTLHKDKPVFVYSIRNGRSSQVANKLKEKGFAEVYELPGGIAAWIGSGRKLEGIEKVGMSLTAFQQHVKQQDVVLVEVGTQYCGACKKQALIVDSLKREQGISTWFIDLYDNQSLAQQLNITAIPALLFYKDGKLSWQHAGLLSKDELAAYVLKDKEALVKTK